MNDKYYAICELDKKNNMNIFKRIIDFILN